MKTLITLFFALVIGATTQAQNPTKHIKVKTIAAPIVGSAIQQEIVTGAQDNVAVIYIFKNAKIKKALSFRTTKNRAKLV
jgi:hypothetical protein